MISHLVTASFSNRIAFSTVIVKNYLYVQISGTTREESLNGAETNFDLFLLNMLSVIWRELLYSSLYFLFSSLKMLNFHFSLGTLVLILWSFSHPFWIIFGAQNCIQYLRWGLTKELLLPYFQINLLRIIHAENKSQYKIRKIQTTKYQKKEGCEAENGERKKETSLFFPADKNTF